MPSSINQAPIQHPLPIGTSVIAERPSCNCRNAKIETITGVIQKVITNHSGIWYFLQTGNGSATVKQAMIKEVR